MKLALVREVAAHKLAVDQEQKRIDRQELESAAEKLAPEASNNNDLTQEESGVLEQLQREARGFGLSLSGVLL